MKEVINFWNNLYYSDRAFLLKQLFKNTALLFCKVFTLERSGTMWVKVYIGFVLLFISFKGFSHSGEESKLPSSLSGGENIQESATPGEKAEPSSNLSEEDIKLACEAPFQTPLLSQEQYSVAKLKRAMISMDYKALRSEYPYLPIDDEFRLWELYKKYKDNRSFQVLFLSGLHLVHHATWDFIKKRGGEYEDYFQVAIPAFLKAFEKFDPSRGTRLNQFAHTSMRREMNQYREEEDRLVAVSETTLWNLKIALIAALNADKSISVTESWMRKFAEKHPEYDIEDIRFILPFVQRREPYSLDSFIKADGTDSESWLDSLSDKKQNTERQAIAEVDFSHIYDWVVKAVRERQEAGDKKFSQKLTFYQAIIDGRLLVFDDRESISKEDIAKQFEVTYPTVRNAEGTIRQMIKDQFQHSGYGKTFQNLHREKNINAPQNELDIQQIYNWTLEAARSKKRIIKKNFHGETDFYKTVINDRIFTLFPRSASDIAKEFEVSSKAVSAIEQSIRKMMKDQFPYLGYEAFQKLADLNESMSTQQKELDIQQIYNWTLKVVREQKESGNKKFSYPLDFYEAIITDRIFTLFPRAVSDITIEFKVPFSTVPNREKIIRKMIKDRFLP